MTEDMVVRLVPLSLDDFIATMTPALLEEHEARHVGEGDIAVLRRRMMQTFLESRTELLGRFDRRAPVGELGEWLDAVLAYRNEVWSEAGYADCAYQRLLTVFRAVEGRPRRAKGRTHV